MVDESDGGLLERARSGDSAAFQQLRGRLEKPVRRFVHRLVGSGDREEIVQDAFTALYMNLERIDPERLRPFLYRVVRNRCYDELRRRGRFEVLAPEEDAAEESGYQRAPDPRPQPDALVKWIFVHSELHQAIDRLPELQRQTLLLYSEEDLSYASIADAMGTDIGTVKSRLYYARRNLVRMLDPEILAAMGLGKER